MCFKHYTHKRVKPSVIFKKNWNVWTWIVQYSILYATFGSNKQCKNLNPSINVPPCSHANITLACQWWDWEITCNRKHSQTCTLAYLPGQARMLSVLLAVEHPRVHDCMDMWNNAHGLRKITTAYCTSHIAMQQSRKPWVILQLYEWQHFTLVWSHSWIVIL